MSVIDWVDGVTPLDDANLSQLEQIGRKGVPSGYPPLDADGKIPPQYLPPNGGVVIVGEYTFTTSLSGDPGSGKAGTNNADQTLATLLSISEQTGGGIDVSAVLASLVAGERIYFQDKLDSSHYRLYDVTAVPTDAGAYRTIPVTFNKGAFANFANNAKLIVGIQRLAGAAGGGGGGLDWEGAWAAGIAYVKGDVVTYNGVTYGAVNDSTGQTPPAAQAAPGALPVIPLVTSLPASPFDGMEVILTDSLTAPTFTWRLRYVAAKATNKWVYVGGTPLQAEVQAGDASFSSTSYAAAATAGPVLTVPVTGIYLVQHGFTPSNAGAFMYSYMSYDIGATPASDNDCVGAFYAQGAAGPMSVARSNRKTLTGGTVLTSKYKVSGSTITISFRYLTLIPVAVGG